MEINTNTNTEKASNLYMTKYAPLIKVLANNARNGLFIKFSSKHLNNH